MPQWFLSTSEVVPDQTPPTQSDDPTPKARNEAANPGGEDLAEVGGEDSAEVGGEDPTKSADRAKSSQERRPPTKAPDENGNASSDARPALDLPINPSGTKWAACKTDSDCVLTHTKCCPPCGTLGPDRLHAVARKRLNDHFRPSATSCEEIRMGWALLVLNVRPYTPRRSEPAVFQAPASSSKPAQRTDRDVLDTAMVCARTPSQGYLNQRVTSDGLTLILDSTVRLCEP